MESDSDTPPPRPSKFKEATMNSVTSIHPPPDELWRDLGIERLLDKFNDENKAPPKSKKEAAPPAPPPTEGTFGRFSRAITTFFGGGGGGFSTLGKRKAGNQTVEKDDRRKQAEQAYQEAKELGLLPAPKVFVRPTAKPHRSVTTPADTPTPTSQSMAPTPYASSHKKDLQKQKKLTKRVSDLEFKLAAARKELSLALSPENLPPVPPLPTTLPSTPTPQPVSERAPSQPVRESGPSQPVRESEPSQPMRESGSSHPMRESGPSQPVLESEPSPLSVERPASSSKQGKITVEGSASSSKQGKITKKRKVTTDDQAYKPVTTDSDFSVEESERSTKRSKSVKKPKRQSSRLTKSKGNKPMEEVVIVVPDGVSVPPIPSIPKEVGGKRAAVRDDGYGGLGHEMF